MAPISTHRPVLVSLRYAAREALAYLRETQTPESMTIVALEFIDQDAPELLDLGVRADAVRVCRVAELLRVNTDAKKRRA